ncbi:MAG: hypothetical protein WBO04_04015 [Steroidobacteraceae bacterium]
MSAPTIRVLGVHPVEASPELLREAYEIKYGSLILSESERRHAEQALRAEIGETALIELQIDGRDDRFDAGDFHQENSEQAAYAETYLTEDGVGVIGDSFEPPSDSRIRLAFFLHFFDPSRNLQTSYGSVALPAMTPMPDRLKRLVPYEPVD